MSTFGTLFEIVIDVKNYKEQIIQTVGKEGEKAMDTKSTGKREKFLSKVEEALEAMLSTRIEEDAEVNNVILRDLVRLENSASAGSVSVAGVCENEGNLSFKNGFVVDDNPMSFAHRLN